MVRREHIADGRAPGRTAEQRPVAAIPIERDVIEGVGQPRMIERSGPLLEQRPALQPAGQPDGPRHRGRIASQLGLDQLPPEVVGVHHRASRPKPPLIARTTCVPASTHRAIARLRPCQGRRHGSPARWPIAMYHGKAALLACMEEGRRRRAAVRVG